MHLTLVAALRRGVRDRRVLHSGLGGCRGWGRGWEWGRGWGKETAWIDLVYQINL